MNSKVTKILYYSVTALYSLLMLMSAGMYIFANEMAVENFTIVQFPTFIIYPLAIAKILGVIAIWVNKYKHLKEWAYAGFFFNALLAISAHLNVNDGEHIGGVMALVLVTLSYVFYRRMENQKAAV